MGVDIPESDARTSKAEPLPHYALPNFSVVLPTFSNHEADVITNAFRVGNFVSLHDLPANVKPGQVSRSRFQKILDNRQETVENKLPHSKPTQFSIFEYVPSPYSIADDLARDARIASNAAMVAAGHEKPFHMSDTQIKLPHEDGFGGEFNPYKRGADPYERADDQALRYQWLQDALILSVPFRPSGRVKGQTGQAATEMPTRAGMPYMVDRVREAIEEDWSEYAFLVCSTDDEHLVVRFELSTLDAEPGQPIGRAQRDGPCGGESGGKNEGRGEAQRVDAEADAPQRAQGFDARPVHHAAADVRPRGHRVRQTLGPRAGQGGRADQQEYRLAHPSRRAALLERAEAEARGRCEPRRAGQPGVRGWGAREASPPSPNHPPAGPAGHPATRPPAHWPTGSDTPRVLYHRPP